MIILILILYFSPQLWPVSGWSARPTFWLRLLRNPAAQLGTGQLFKHAATTAATHTNTQDAQAHE